ncbi:hypothetical protein Acel_0740 [Acidothermus cellulolyticus 11B]|uniref:Uncharacterized protein n=1 Tax=Acidothermus cellulolyticus (strain ATCC 43068 / DSM 8971 / 11B) TaxID=351607 RepID=A0LSV3_ACIC1|nr:hypothetical protein [Acidothermus cellulolyticus]ABK52513.1 hypothetical protein Acel_0740 [Acidothermus cellulolyticus 11B]
MKDKHLDDTFQSPYAITVLPGRGRTRKDQRGRGKVTDDASQAAPAAAVPPTPPGGPTPASVPGSVPPGTAPTPAPTAPGAAPVGGATPGGGVPISAQDYQSAPPAYAAPPAYPSTQPGYGPAGYAQGYTPAGYAGYPAPGTTPAGYSPPGTTPAATPGYPTPGPVPQAPGAVPGYVTPGSPSSPGYAAAPGGYAAASAGYAPPTGYAAAPAGYTAASAPPSYAAVPPADAPTVTAEANPPEQPGQSIAPAKRRRLGALIAAAVVVLAAGGYYLVPKYVLHHGSTATPATISFPVKLGSAPRVTDTALVDPVRAQVAKLRTASPALSAAGFAVYGTGPRAVVIAGAIPSTASVKTTDDQIRLVTVINKTLAAQGQAATLRQLSSGDPATGQWWCGALRGGKAGTECIAVDRGAVVIVTVYGTNTTANIATASTIRHQVEQ